MNSKRRYTLTIMTEEEKVDVVIPDAIDSLNHLSDIDLFTMQFASEKALITFFKYELQKKGIKIDQSMHVSITYKSNKTENQIRIIYKDKDILAEYASEGSSTVKTEKSDYLFKIFMQNIINGKLYRHLKEMNLINSRLNYMLEECIYNGKKIYEGKIKEEISRYKVARGIIIGLLSYEKKYDAKLIKKSIKPQSDKQIDSKINAETDDEFLDYLLANGDREQILSRFSLEELESYGVLNLIIETNNTHTKRKQI